MKEAISPAVVSGLSVCLSSKNLFKSAVKSVSANKSIDDAPSSATPLIA